MKAEPFAKVKALAKKKAKRKRVTAKLEWVNPNHHLEMMKLKVAAEAKVTGVLAILHNGQSPSAKLRAIENLFAGG